MAGWLDNQRVLIMEEGTRLVTVNVETGAREPIFRTRGDRDRVDADSPAETAPQ